ncbi:hypothetical protein WMY93_014711 [Mugilogobius chulae]|uniref:Uncharacterized protein n=1 Tax=Mugilogobius chulae TaxID=88201 RepID=A0AAW0P2C2_9GOBI
MQKFSVTMERVVLILLLLLPLCCGHSEYQGKVMTYYSLETYSDGAVLMEFHYRSNSKTCVSHRHWCPDDGCLTISFTTTPIDYSPEGFCQVDSIWTRNSSSEAPFKMVLYSDTLWSSPIANGVVTAGASILVELRKRSDTGQANRCPQTTILPVFRVPYNCPRDIQLLSFDPDGDLVQCRFANDEIDPTECANCTLPSVLSLSSPCTLSFSASSSSSSQGRYAVQLAMEDFPRTQITLSQTNGQQEVKDTTTGISKIPVQFLFAVESAAPSCTSGLFLPTFVTPTPAHGTQINLPVKKTMNLYIAAQASEATVTELVFSGPSNMTEIGSGGQYILSWTPTDTELGQSHPVCFSAQAALNASKYSSELRCVVVNVGNEALKSALVKKIRMELVKRGMIDTVTASLKHLNSTLKVQEPSFCN